MKLTIEGTQEEIKNTLQAISGSEERENKKSDIVTNLTLDGSPIGTGHTLESG
ncbi:hypothetical protein [Weissella minor]|uniref:hypothetical protein n=1 Tax=Weissella minor TaxID=1620 RepID=UPI003AF317C7